jgi:squalene synthase HpnC
VRLRLLPAALQPHAAAVYAYAAVADEIANQRATPAASRQAQLDAWQRRLHAAVDDERSGRAPGAHDEWLVVALAHSIRSLDLPVGWLDDLVSACGQDTMTSRYASWAELFDHCARAANPLGRLVLRAAGYCDPTLDAASDALCTALQLTGWWQHFSDDWLIGRLFVPREVSASCRAREMELDAPWFNDAWMAAMRQCVDRTRAQFEAGRALGDCLGGRLGYERRLTWLSGRSVLDSIERAGPTLRSERPALRVSDALILQWRSIRWRSPRG